MNTTRKITQHGRIDGEIFYRYENSNNLHQADGLDMLTLGVEISLEEWHIACTHYKFECDILREISEHVEV